MNIHILVYLIAGVVLSAIHSYVEIRALLDRRTFLTIGDVTAFIVLGIVYILAWPVLLFMWLTSTFVCNIVVWKKK